MNDIMFLVGVVAVVIVIAIQIGLIIAIFQTSSNTKQTAEELAQIRSILANEIKSRHRSVKPVDNQTSMPESL